MLWLIAPVGLLVVDEGRSASATGATTSVLMTPLHRLGAEALLPDVPVLCTTATANDRVIDDITDQLGDALQTFLVARRSARAWCSPPPTCQPGRVPRLGSCRRSPAWRVRASSTRSSSPTASGWPPSCVVRGSRPRAYSGAMDYDDRVRLEQALLGNELKVLVATSALGMGFDKPDLGFCDRLPVPRLAHRLLPAGRCAGRALDHAPAVLLRRRRGPRGTRTTSSRPRSSLKRQAEEIVDLLGSAPAPMSLNELMAAVNVRDARAWKSCSRCSRWRAPSDGSAAATCAPMRRGRIRPSGSSTSPCSAVTSRTRCSRTPRTPGCLMEFLRTELDHSSAGAVRALHELHRLAPARGGREPLRAAAREHLLGLDLFVEPRKQWPLGMGALDAEGWIAQEERPETGRALGDGRRRLGASGGFRSRARASASATTWWPRPPR